MTSKIVTFGPIDERSKRQLETCIAASGEPDALGVLCADHHPGYSMPIGGVLALRDHVIPAGVGYDIGCGNLAVELDVDASIVDVPVMMDQIAKTISFGMGRANGERVDDHPVFERILSSPVVEQRRMIQLAQNQLGTVGSGNHYVDLFEDRDTGNLWIGVHFGSRGFGHKTASGFLAIAAGRSFSDRVSEGGMDSPPNVLALDRPSGHDYLEAMAIAGEYAYAGREWVVGRVMRILGLSDDDVLQTVHNHHNYAWMERHGGETFCVIRKGATPANDGQHGFVGGTMGEDAVILRGVSSERSDAALRSTVHGAGRVMGRNQARGKTKRTLRWKCQNYRECAYSAPKGGYFKAPNGPTPKCPNCGHKLRLTPIEEQVAPGLIDWPAALADLKAKRIELRGGAADEAPLAYKRLDEVLAHHEGTIEIVHRLRPIGVAMAGADVEDLYRD